MKRITTFVISAHLIVIVLLLFTPVKKGPKPTKHVVVRTVQPKPQPMTIVSNTPAPKAKRTTNAKPKKEIPPTKKTTAPTPKPKPVAKKTAVIEKNKPKATKPKKEPEVWQEVDEPLAKIDAKEYSAPKLQLDVPQIETSFSVFAGNQTQEESLVGFLHSSLNLPEFGEVTIQLTMKKDGTVARLVVVKAESKKNKAYLEQHLPLLKFPLILENEKTFTLTFCNEI
jgi:type IV secretory pathway VirB10-like protein